MTNSNRNDMVIAYNGSNRNVLRFMSRKYPGEDAVSYLRIRRNMYGER